MGQSASTKHSKLGKTRPTRATSAQFSSRFPVKCNFLTPSWAFVFLYIELVESPVVLIQKVLF